MPLSKGGSLSGGTVTSVTATDTSVVVAGTAVAPTIATATLDVIATVHPPAASVPLNAKKITGLANGSAATDAAAFGQIPTLGQLQLVYRYTVTGSDKAGIDTGVDTPDAGTNDWTNGDLLEVFFYHRTDEAAVTSNSIYSFNNDTSGVYDEQHIAGNNASASAGAAVAAAGWSLVGTGANKGAGAFAVVNMQVPNYTGTVGNKIVSCQAKLPDATAGNQFDIEYALQYRSTAALTRLKAIPATPAKKYTVGSQLVIYKRLAS